MQITNIQVKEELIISNQISQTMGQVLEPGAETR